MLWDCLSQYAEQAPADDETVGDLSEETSGMPEILKKYEETKQFQSTLASLKKTHAPMMRFAKSIASDDRIDGEGVRTRLSEGLNKAIEQDIRKHHKEEHANMLWDCLSQYAEQTPAATDPVELPEEDDLKEKEAQLKQKFTLLLGDEAASYFKILKQEKKQKLYSGSIASACVGFFLYHYLKTPQILSSPKILTILFAGMILATIVSTKNLYDLTKKRKKRKKSIIIQYPAIKSGAIICPEFFGTKAERQKALLKAREQRTENREQRTENRYQGSKIRDHQPEPNKKRIGQALACPSSSALVLYSNPLFLPNWTPQNYQRLVFCIPTPTPNIPRARPFRIAQKKAHHQSKKR